MIGQHVIFGAYGFWLPNDPRGSWSTFVGSWDLFRYGPATTTAETRSVAHVDHDRAQRFAAKKALKYPPVQFSETQVQAIAHGFAGYARCSGLIIWACAILPDHVHLVIGPHRLDADKIVIQLKGDATQSLLDAGIHPFGHITEKNGRPPKCFARGEWQVYLDTSDEVVRAIRYVENNPIKEGKPLQVWPFVVPFDSD
jgi:REP element-mobilizing transposase RayT